MRADGTGLKRLTAVTPPNQVRFLAFGGQPPRVAYDDNFGIWTIRPDGTDLRHVLRGHGWENELAIAPRGSTIAYAKNDTARSPALLGIVPLSGGPARVVFRGTRHACGISSPTWSPDEHWIAFALCVSKGGFDQEIGVWLIRPDGTELHRLVPGGAEPIWSPDGEWIAFVAFDESSQQNEELGALEAVRPDGSDRTSFTPRVRAEEVVESPSW